MTHSNRKQQDRKSQGVTLVELLIVMAILVVISGLGLPSVMRMVDRSRLNSTTRELQAELNRTRLEAMKSGEPLVFHYQLGTGCYEIMSKQQYDLRFPRQQQPAGSSPYINSRDDMMPQNAIVPDAGLQLQAAGSTGPSLGDHVATSLADSLAGQSSSLGDFGAPPSLGDLGPPASFADSMAEPDMQMVAAMPVGKFVPVQKELPFELVFRGQTSGFGLQLSQWSEPIFFFPNGRTSNAQFAVCAAKGKRQYIDVSVRGLTGTARIGKIEVMP